MRRLILLLTMLTIAATAFSQQQTLWSQHIFNDFALNPAVAGAKDYVPVHLAIRRQWAGIKDAPFSQVLSAHGNVGYNIGIGGVLINEIAGPTRRTGLHFSMAYHLRLTAGSKYRKPTQVLSFGLTGAFNQHRIDNSMLTTFEPDDQTIIEGFQNDIVPDMNVGIYYHNTNKFYAGFSIFNLVESKVDLYSLIDEFNNPLERHYYLTAGYNWEVNEFINIQPSAIFRMIEATPFQFDIQTRVLYKKQHWLTVGYRHQEAVIFGGGVQLGLVRVGYTYDLLLNDIAQFSSGSHEVSLTFMFLDEHKKRIGKPGDRIYRDREFRPTIRDF